MLKNLNTQDFLEELDKMSPELETLQIVSADAPKPEPSEGPPKWTVLVVDDEKEVRAVMSRIVTRAGHDVVTAADGKAALEILAERDDIDLVFLDALMPKLDGLKTVARVRDGGKSELPVVMVSGRATSKHIIGGYKAGVDYYVTKPFRPRTILNIMNYLLGDLPEDSGLDLEQLL
jgi:DNA-binding response OmpR family regulator